MIKLKDSAIESSNSKKHFCRNIDSKFVGNKAKGRISKWVSQVNKACQVFCKTNISYSMIRTRACTYQRVRNVHFAEILACFFFQIGPFALLLTNCRLMITSQIYAARRDRNFVLSRVASYMNFDKKDILKTYITSLFIYCPLVWMCYNRSLNKIQTFHMNQP